MKRYILPAAIAALSMLSCQKELADPAQPDQAPAPGELTEMTFSATVEENDTKTYIDATDGFKAFWETTDQIALYADGTKAEASFTVKEGTASGTTADFTGTVASGASASSLLFPQPVKTAADIDNAIIIDKVFFKFIITSSFFIIL